MTVCHIRPKHDFVLSTLPFDELLQFWQALVDINVGINRFASRGRITDAEIPLNEIAN